MRLNSKYPRRHIDGEGIFTETTSILSVIIGELFICKLFLSVQPEDSPRILLPRTNSSEIKYYESIHTTYRILKNLLKLIIFEGNEKIIEIFENDDDYVSKKTYKDFITPYINDQAIVFALTCTDDILESRQYIALEVAIAAFIYGQDRLDKDAKDYIDRHFGPQPSP
jgi:hypothetical protein